MNTYLRPRVSRDLQKRIIYYYKELYENLEMKTIPEIANELGVSASAIHKFLKCNYVSIENGEYSPIMVMIMLCTKFGNTSCYHFEQQEKFGEIIKKRAILKDVKSRNEKLNQKRKVKGLK